NNNNPPRDGHSDTRFLEYCNLQRKFRCHGTRPSMGHSSYPGRQRWSIPRTSLKE
ncbi:hypothetical protein K0M31_020448, partial [Melipona bicolor]